MTDDMRGRWSGGVVRRRERTRFFADHGGARCSFVSLLVQSDGTKLSRGGAKMNTPNGDLDRWPEPAVASVRRSVFAPDLVVEGDVTSSAPIDVQGKVVGSMRAPDVVVAGSGRVEGSVIAHDLVVLGAVAGTISARNVHFAPSALVHADVIHERIAIEAGAELEGRLQRKA
jgi:cytoskeletal protein CcmA (bactofilin family)